MTGVRTSFPIMGSVASIAIAEHSQGDVDAAIGVAMSSLAADEQRFSHYRENSDIERWIRQEEISAVARYEIDEVIAHCLELRERSGGAFSYRNPSRNRIDTAGFVKGWAIERAQESMRRFGITDACIGVGGDTTCWGSAEPDRPWRIAIADPTRDIGVAAIVEFPNGGAIATSGTAQRGEHIWRIDNADHDALASFSVVGPSITWADAYSTTGFALGLDGMAWVAQQAGYASISVTPDGEVFGDAVVLQPQESVSPQ